jgi:hypothetical protein
MIHVRAYSSWRKGEFYVLVAYGVAKRYGYLGVHVRTIYANAIAQSSHTSNRSQRPASDHIVIEWLL